MKKRNEKENKDVEEIPGAMIICIGDPPPFLVRNRKEHQILCFENEHAARKYFRKGIIETVDNNIWVWQNGRPVSFHLHDLVFAEVCNHHLDIVLRNRVLEDVKMPLHVFVALVNNRFFVRCHRSFAVNIHHIREIRSMGNRSWKANLYCPTEHHCYIGAKYYDGLSRSLKRLQGIME